MTAAELARVPLNQFGHVVTRDGRQVRIVANDLQHPHYTVLGVIRDANGRDFIANYTAEGRVFYSQPKDNEADLFTLAEHEAAQAEALFE